MVIVTGEVVAKRQYHPKYLKAFAEGEGFMSNISLSLERYLEAILDLKAAKDFVRITDLADQLRVTKASVNRAVTKLAALKLITHERYGPVTLTLQGETEARKVQKRQQILKQFLGQAYGVDPRAVAMDVWMPLYCRVKWEKTDDSIGNGSIF
jgi:DNA-binding MarR family transcriptional regulator